MIVRVCARRPSGKFVAFVVEGDTLADVAAAAVDLLRDLAAMLPPDAVWSCEQWKHPRPT